MTTHSFLSHYVCWKKGVYRLQLLHADTHSHTVTVEPYEKECAGTRFCDGLLLAANTSFESEKNALIARLKEKGLFTLPQLADYLSCAALYTHYCTPPLNRLYALVPQAQKQEIVLQEILQL